MPPPNSKQCTRGCSPSSSSEVTRRSAATRFTALALPDSPRRCCLIHRAAGQIGASIVCCPTESVACAHCCPAIGVRLQLGWGYREWWITGRKRDGGGNARREDTTLDWDELVLSFCRTSPSLILSEYSLVGTAWFPYL